MERLEAHRRLFSRLVTANVGIANPEHPLVKAFASVPRERFVGTGPWQIFTAGGYIETSSDDPALIYQDVTNWTNRRDEGIVQSRRTFLKSGLIAGATATPSFAWAYERFLSGAERVYRPQISEETQMDFDINGYRMHYEVFGAAGEPLLWLHGWSGSGEDWKFIFNDVPAGFHIVGPDLKGNGASSGFDGTHTFRQSAREIFALLDHLGIQRIKAIGLSGGGITLLHMATQQPERIVAMVAVSAPPYFPAQARTLQAAFSFESLPKREQDMMRQRSKGGDKQIAWLVEQSHKMAESYDDVNFTPPLLHTITAKTLIVFGDSDPLYPVRLAFELQDAIPRSSLWVVPKGGHGPVFGPHAPRFAETAVAFLRTEAQSR